MPALIGVVFTFLARIFGDNVLRWIAMKAALLFLFIVVMPLVFNNFLADILKMMFDMIDTNTGSVSALNPTFTASDLAGWFVLQLKLTECISVIMSALILKTTLKMIPFVRL